MKRMRIERNDHHESLLILQIFRRKYDRTTSQPRGELLVQQSTHHYGQPKPLCLMFPVSSLETVQDPQKLILKIETKAELPSLQIKVN